ncbi:MAG: RluA family pseudouridine synthase [Treponema sp.]|nr:RluA family pseudouridine synthase [Treponema sp.]
MKNLEYSVIYSDDDIVVLNKKSGYLVAADRYDLESPRLDECASKEFGPLFAVHRIDTDASGIVVYARNQEIQQALAVEFQEQRVEKKYHCLVNGHPLWENLHVDLKLLPDGDQRHRTTVNQKLGKIAVTDYKMLGNCGPFSWIEAIPRTSRTHQIRVHLKENGVTIVCDPLYSGNQKPVRLSEIKRRWNGDEFEERPLLSRLALHAYSLTFTHPKTGETVTYRAPYQKDMDAVRKQLAKIFKIDPIGEDC